MTTSSTPRVAVVGAGWSGAVVAHQLNRAGVGVHIYEEKNVTGGHSRAERLCGVVYEPEGPHIFHTSNPAVAAFVQRHGMTRTFEHHGHTEIFLHPDDPEPVLLSWPPQVDELRELPVWTVVERELAELPARPAHDNLEAYCVSIMGRTLYTLFIRDYTVKQWGCDPTELSSSFAPGRLDLRRDGYRRLFRDTWEFYPAGGAQECIDSILTGLPSTAGRKITSADFGELERDFDAVVITAPLDDLIGQAGKLAWRGIRSVSTYHPTEDERGTVTPAYIINRPSLRRPYTRTVEAKHATGQRIAGTVVSEEYPGGNACHYPVATPDDRYQRVNESLQREITAMLAIPTFYCGRLANYVYINQDAAIEQGMACATAVLDRLRAE